MRTEPYRRAIEMLLAQLPAGDEVLRIAFELRPSDGSEGGSRMTVRATTIGPLDDRERACFPSWPTGPLLRHWVGFVDDSGNLALSIASVDHPQAP